MATVYVISLLGLAGAVTALQYKSYKKSHPVEGKCNCK